MGRVAVRIPGGEQIRDIKGHFGSGFGINWIGLGAFVKEVKSIPADVDLDQRCKQLAKDIQTYARDNAPWEDATGNAREGLQADTDFNAAGDHAIYLFHTEEYGVFLENANGGAYAIIIPTMEKFAGELDARMFGPGTK
jgi:hypothetical protein